MKNIMVGQEKSTYYYKSNGKETSKIEKAQYSIELTKKEGKIHLTKVLLENKTIIQQTDLKSWDPLVEDGVST